ncbi:hypothetical protein OIY81_2196 [Cryptosporidium canis]|uniref:Coatomer subunit beta n=1 Tax=Cryptosporidium canis TaxID=195482 RepID=A0ABQ8P8X4_9CRYT|nr:hypothetical protein OIY81_2196 [Cryptosporidium canis]KAJ1612750.1 hypothetical protein OJ252_1155 [Cryptosporidium canis]
MFEYEKNCTLLVPAAAGSSAPTSSELQKRLEDPSDGEKCKALRELIIWMTNGESYSRLLMTVIRYVVQSTNHKVKKYLQLYWEVVEKCNEDGSLKEEMILVCNALRNDLQHPNEYIRGSTLRLLCNLRFIKLIQPLIESILENLQHRHSYVRRNAVMCIYSIIKTFGVEIIPSAVDEVEKLLLIEGDVSTKRNAFLVLTHCDVERSLRYILSIQENVTYMGDVIQMVLLELLGKNCKDYPSFRNNLVQLIVNITQSGSPAVSFEGANTLIKIGNSTPNSTIKIALQAYINLLLTHSDNNVRYIVLNRISKITSITSALYILQKSFVKDILRVLLCSDCYSLQIKVIEIMLSSLLTKNNCLDIFQFLLKHLQDISIQSQSKFSSSGGGGDAGSGCSGGGMRAESPNGCSLAVHAAGGHGAAVAGHHGAGLGEEYGNYDFNSTYGLTSGFDLGHGEFGGLGVISSRGGVGGRMSDLQQFQSYQLILIKSLHRITRRYHKITFKPMIDTMVTFLSNSNPIVVNEITQFLKEMAISYPEYQNEIASQLITHMPYIQFSRPLRTCLWILSECDYQNDKEKISSIINVIYSSLEPLPLRGGGPGIPKRNSQSIMGGSSVGVDLCGSEEDGDRSDGLQTGGECLSEHQSLGESGSGSGGGCSSNIITKTVILEDGTYSTQNVEYNMSGASMGVPSLVGDQLSSLAGEGDRHAGVGVANHLRSIIVRDEDLILVASIGVSLVKLLCTPCLAGEDREDSEIINFGVEMYNKVLYVIVCLLRFCLNDQKSGGIQNDTTHRLVHCYLLLKSIYEDLGQQKVGDRQESLGDMVNELVPIKLSERTKLLKRRLFPSLKGIHKIDECSGERKDGMKLRKELLGEKKSLNAISSKRYPYNVVNFRQLKEKMFSNKVDIAHIDDDEEEEEVVVMVGERERRNEFGYVDGSVGSMMFGSPEGGGLRMGMADNSSCKRIYPITGFNDPIYIEAILQVQHQDVLLELIVTNKSCNAVQNVQIELYPYGNLRVVEKPQVINHLDPRNTTHVYSTAQVMSIETGILFGFVTFQTKSSSGDGVGASGGSGVSGGSSYSSASSSQLLGLNDIVVLNEISIDLVDFITDSNIPSPLFRQLWSEFEWENKIPIHSNCDSFIQFLRYLMKETKLSLVGCDDSEGRRPASGEDPCHLVMMDENSSFFAANLYARSIFGEDALVNLSLEKQQSTSQKEDSEREPKTMINGTVRIRSRTQGIALSLGDHIVSLQRRIPMEELQSIGGYVDNDENQIANEEMRDKRRGLGRYGVGFEDSRGYGRHSRLLNIDFGEIY